ncbi:MAG: aminopeptidase P family N-terminal domain-containing protein [Bacteroidales bacterium]|nr:aminopeptidase P family N-terminal domain-containing protein [Bacteroidales bacterium]
MNQIQERLSRLRLYMKTFNIDLCIVPTADYHQSEYVAEHFKYRAYLSGFSGSAGTLAVSADQAKLWTDSRYFLQAEQQLAGSSIELMKMRTENYPSLHEWIASEKFQHIGIDGEVFSVQEVKDLQACLKENAQLNVHFKTYDAVWTDRPALPDAPAYLLDESICGESCAHKLQRIRQAMKQQHCQYYLLCALDEIAWTFNLRGSDIAYNPTALCYAMIGEDSCRLYIDENKLSSEDKQKLSDLHIELLPYLQFSQDISSIPYNNKVCFDANKINYLVYAQIPTSCQAMHLASIVGSMKAIKNETELQGIRRAMIKDGVCFVRFWKQLEEQLAENQSPGEYELAMQLAEERLKQDSCVGESFDAIVAYGANGAIVHYSASAETQTKVAYGNILLIDQGGQYRQDGTTDMTRTLALYKSKEEIPEEYLQDYAAVLKGNIALGLAVFPAGTRGCQLDVLARQFLWKQSCNYGHGTGHGIGHFLNVHEGPQSIRMEENPVKLEEGMIISNEPGLYKSGRYGIRLETMVAVKCLGESEFGKFLGFETLTICPWDLNSIDSKYYSQDELDYINRYHQEVYQALSPYLNEEEQVWLANKTKSI